jgi:hypothetical protein
VTDEERKFWKGLNAFTCCLSFYFEGKEKARGTRGQETFLLVQTSQESR